MPPKRERKKGRVGKKVPETKGVATCRFMTPGPEYQLKTLVGYKNHCVSRYRNPAYTFGGRGLTFKVAEGPGPKYLIEERKPKGFSFGLSARRREVAFGPGPKYKLPDAPRGPFFSIKWRTNPRKISETPGPYYVKPIADAPAFSMGLRTVKKPMISVDPYSPYNLEAVKPRSPMYTMAGRGEFQIAVYRSPGPKYVFPPAKPTPAYSFGVKHSECAPPYITEHDE